jgi:hypothetical protein
MPGRDQTLSCLHTTGLRNAEIWEIAKKTLGTQAGRDKIYGRAELQVAAILASKLKAVRDDFEIERHVTVSGWPAPGLDKADQKEIALRLSKAATYHEVPRGPLRNAES